MLTDGSFGQGLDYVHMDEEAGPWIKRHDLGRGLEGLSTSSASPGTSPYFQSPYFQWATFPQAPCPLPGLGASRLSIVTLRQNKSPFF